MMKKYFLYFFIITILFFCCKCIFFLLELKKKKKKKKMEVAKRYFNGAIKTPIETFIKNCHNEMEETFQKHYQLKCKTEQMQKIIKELSMWKTKKR